MRKVLIAAAALLLTVARPAAAQSLDGRSAESLYNKVKSITAPYHLPNEIAVLNILQDGTYKPYADDRVGHWFAQNVSLYRDEHFPKGTLTQPQAYAMFHLGELLQVTHFSLVNAGNPDMQKIAANSCKQLATILAPTQLPGVADTFEKLAASPGPTQVNQCDDAMRKVDAYVANNYGHDGVWYFALGTAAAGLHAVYEGCDAYHAPEYRDLLHDMLLHQPDVAPPAGLRRDIDRLLDIGWPEDQCADVAAAAQKILDLFWTGKEV
ncbi:MAG: hypothetical protein ACYCW6_19920 [Candidatus Xenobia bacterium]